MHHGKGPIRRALQEKRKVKEFNIGLGMGSALRRTRMPSIARSHGKYPPIQIRCISRGLHIGVLTANSSECSKPDY
jgi:hypothetical protein